MDMLLTTRNDEKPSTCSRHENPKGVLIITEDVFLYPDDPEIPVLIAPEGFYAGAVVSEVQWDDDPVAVSGKAVFINPVTNEVRSPNMHITISTTVSKDKAICFARIAAGVLIGHLTSC